MTEDDTFRILRRTPPEEVKREFHRLFDDLLSGDIEWVDFLEHHGYTSKEWAAMIKETTIFLEKK